MAQDFGQIIIRKKEQLIKELVTMLPATTVHIIGPSGSGKTSLVESLMDVKELGIDEIKILRLQGVLSEDFRMPIIKTIKKKVADDGLFGENEVEEKVVELVNMGIFQEILDNPNKKYLILLDEILRADSSVVPLLFGLLERRINGIPAPNMYVVACSNYGGEYIQNFDFSDSALRRRQIFIEYIPCKEDIVEFMDQHEYNETLREIVSSLNIDEIINHNSTTKELEQDTQLGSWNLLNHRWNILNVKTYGTAEEDIILYGNYFFSNKTKLAISNKLALFKQIAEIDIQKEIIENKGLKDGNEIHTKKGKVFDKEDRITELMIRTKTFILNETFKDKNYFIKYFDDIIEVFDKDMMLLISLLSDIKIKSTKLLQDKKNKNVILLSDITKLISEKSKDNDKIGRITQELIKSVQLAI